MLKNNLHVYEAIPIERPHRVWEKGKVETEPFCAKLLITMTGKTFMCYILFRKIYICGAYKSSAYVRMQCRI